MRKASSKSSLAIIGRWFAPCMVAACLANVLVQASPAGGEVRSVVFVAGSEQAWSNGLSGKPALEATNPLTADALRRRNAMVIGGGALAVGTYGAFTWWNDGLSGFKVRREGWFGQNTNDGGADKLGHLYSNYVGTRLLARALESAGNAPDAALRLAAWSTLATFVGVEFLDAFTLRYRFSPEDAVMNAAGVALGVLMERNPRLDEILDIRLQYRPSRDQRNRGQFDPFGDYSGQTYLVTAKASGVPMLRQYSGLRYLELAIGYGTRGYGLGPEFAENRSRFLFGGVSLNLGRLLDNTMFRGSARNGWASRISRGFFEVFQLPGTAALARDRL